MRILILALALMPSLAFADDDLIKAYKVCDDHRDTSSKMSKITRIKAWQPGFDNCSLIQDKYDAFMSSKAKKDADDKALVDSLTKK